MTTKRSYNAAVTSTQSIKTNNKQQGTNSSYWLQKLDMLYTQMAFLPKPGLKPIKQVHLYTKWRAVVPHPYKDEICPLPSNEVIKMVLKNRKPRRKNTPPRITVNTNPTNSNDSTNNINNTTNNACANTNTNTNNVTTSSTKKQSRPKRKEHETRTITKDGIQQDADPDEVASDDNDSDYINDEFDPLLILQEETEPRRIQPPRGKTFLPPKPKAPTNKTEKLNRDKDVTEKETN